MPGVIAERMLPYKNRLLAVLCLSCALVLFIYWPTADRVNTIVFRDLPSVEQRKFLQSRAQRWLSDKAFHKYLTSPDVICNQSLRVGKVTDGGWDICLSSPYYLRPQCLVYSFGINYDFSFDDGIDQRFRCIVKSFDPSMSKVKSHQRGDGIHFFKYGIAGKDYKDYHGWQMYTYATILKMQDDTNMIIDYLKMDIEWSEWEVLPDMAVSGLLGNVKQIGIEIHRWRKGSVHAIHLVNILEDHGFRKWRMEYNTDTYSTYHLQDGTRTSQCMNFYFINTRFLDADSIKPFLTN